MVAGQIVRIDDAINQKFDEFYPGVPLPEAPTHFSDQQKQIHLLSFKCVALCDRFGHKVGLELSSVFEPAAIVEQAAQITIQEIGPELGVIVCRAATEYFEQIRAADPSKVSEQTVILWREVPGEIERISSAERRKQTEQNDASDAISDFQSAIEQAKDWISNGVELSLVLEKSASGDAAVKHAVAMYLFIIAGAHQIDSLSDAKTNQCQSKICDILEINLGLSKGLEITNAICNLLKSPDSILAKTPDLEFYHLFWMTTGGMLTIRQKGGSGRSEEYSDPHSGVKYANDGNKETLSFGTMSLGNASGNPVVRPTHKDIKKSDSD